MPGDTPSVPEVACVPLQAPDATQLAASAEDHVSVLEAPAVIDVGMAFRETVGVGAVLATCVAVVPVVVLLAVVSEVVPAVAALLATVSAAAAPAESTDTPWQALSATAHARDCRQINETLRLRWCMALRLGDIPGRCGQVRACAIATHTVGQGQHPHAGHGEFFSRTVESVRRERPVLRTSSPTASDGRAVGPPDIIQAARSPPPVREAAMAGGEAPQGLSCLARHPPPFAAGCRRRRTTTTWRGRGTGRGAGRTGARPRPRPCHRGSRTPCPAR